ncbi:hypothetical protein GCM10011322_01830 [Salinarimonas ramus]|uniref:Uncharacterized protein n=1 Tax=Salinarimonas ramus TaxID=690164 RepID=A0A917V1W2_9HYPH|nr:hypothetical protein GCM10011322_01830 [Salinarimonas ramus]
MTLDRNPFRHLAYLNYSLNLSQRFYFIFCNKESNGISIRLPFSGLPRLRAFDGKFTLLTEEMRVSFMKN